MVLHLWPIRALLLLEEYNSFFACDRKLEGRFFDLEVAHALTFKRGEGYDKVSLYLSMIENWRNLIFMAQVRNVLGRLEASRG